MSTDYDNVHQFKEKFYTASVLEYKEKLIDVSSNEKLFDFLHSDVTNYVVSDIILKLQRRKKDFKSINIIKLFESVGLSNLEKIKIDGSFLPIDKLYFTAILKRIEKRVGNILMKEFKTYDEILKLQESFKAFDDFISDKGLVNFTEQQHNQTVTLVKEMDNVELYIRDYLKCIK